ncbi:MAG: septum formation inhibitor Maf, partial [Bacteroidetes bacterium]
LDDQMLAKPADAEEAAAFLRKLSARTHSVFTGVTLFYKGRLRSFAEETLVTFRKLREPEIAHYINEYKPFDKAGAYGIQEWIGLVGISRIEGDYYNVMGLPMARLYEELLQLE